MNRFTATVLQLAVLLLFVGLTADSARAQVNPEPDNISRFAAPGGSTSANCKDPADPCAIDRAIDRATKDGDPNVVYLKVQNIGGSNTFQGELVDETDLVNTSGFDADIDSDLLFSTYREVVPGSGVFEYNVPGLASLNGRMDVREAVTLSIHHNLTFRFVGNKSLVLYDGAYVGPNGFDCDDPTTLGTEICDGLFVFGALSGTQEIFLGDINVPDPDGQKTGTFYNVMVDKGGGAVSVRDQGGNGEGLLNIVNFLNIESGVLNTGFNDLAIIADNSTTTAGVNVEAGAAITGGGTFFISPEGYPNGTPSQHYTISGDGNINMVFDKDTDAGVTIELGEIGAGGESFARCGRLDVTDATVLNGTFSVYLASTAPTDTEKGCKSVPAPKAGGADFEGTRVNFYELQTITSGLLINGPGEELDSQNGLCDGDASGVYFYSAVTVQSDDTGFALEMSNTDDPDTACQTEGLHMEATDLDKGVSGMTVIDGDFGAQGTCIADGPCEPGSTLSGIELGWKAGAKTAEDAFHNIGFTGDWIFDEAPDFQLAHPATAFGAAPGEATGLPLAADCLDGTKGAVGNKVYFVGDTDQEILTAGVNPVQIASVGFEKEDTNNEVEILEVGGNPYFFVDTSLEMIRGEFITNGNLIMNSYDGVDEGDPGTGVVMVNQDGNGQGFVESGDSNRAYVGDEITYTPLKIVYAGTRGYGSADEMPGPSEGSDAGEEIIVPYIELRMCPTDPADDTKIPVITVDKSVSVSEELRITTGILEMGSEELTLRNEVLIAMGDGKIQAFNPNFEGNLIFPNVTEKTCGNFDNVKGPNDPSDALCAGDDGIDLLYFGTTDRTLGLEFSADPHVMRNLRVALTGGTQSGPTISLPGDRRVNPGDEDDEDDCSALDPPQDGDCNFDQGVFIEKGAFDIAGFLFENNAVNGNDGVFYVYRNGNLVDSEDEIVDTTDRIAALDEFRQAVREGRVDDLKASADLMQTLESYRSASKSAEHAGLLKYTGTDDTDTWVDTHSGRLVFAFPAIEVARTDGSHVTFDANGVVSTTLAPIPPNRIDVLRTAHFTLTDADRKDGTDGAPLGGGDHLPGAGGVELYDGLDLLDIVVDYNQYDGEFLMSGVSSLCEAPCQPVVQRVSVGGDFMEHDGEFFTLGGDVDVFGDYYLGDFSGGMEDASGDAIFSLASYGEADGGVLTTVGNYYVAPDSNPDERAVDADEDGDTVFNPLQRNRFECGWGDHVAFGDIWYFGTGDTFDDDDLPLNEQGLRCTTWIAGAVQQNFWMRQDEDSFFNNVAMVGQGLPDDGMLLNTDIWTNRSGWWLFEYSIVDTNDELFDVIILNPSLDGPLALRNNPSRASGTIKLGSRDSYINGEVQRVIEFGSATGGAISDEAYYYPTGLQGELRNDGAAGEREVDIYVPFMLQLVDDLGRASLTRVDFRHDLSGDDFEWPEEGLVVDDAPDHPEDDATLLLDVIAPNYFWQVDFDRIPSFDPNIRVAADELNNVFAIKKLRLIQWDCVDEDGDGVAEGGVNPRLAGLYDTEIDGPVDDGSFFLNDFIDSLPNLTQEGVDVNDCNLIGIASNFLINPINLDELPSGIARVQIIHNSPDAGDVDIYVDDAKYLDDFSFQTATPFIAVPGGSRKIDIVAGSAADNSNPVWTGNVSFSANRNYVLVAQGFVADLRVVVEDDVRLSSTDDDVEFFMIHGAPEAGQVDIRILDPVDNNTVVGLLANNIDFNDVGAYISLPPGGYNIQITNADNSQEYEVYRLDLNALGGQTFVWNLSGAGKSATEGFTIMGVEVDGDTFFPSVITSTDEETELPTEFALKGNYPNPFNPATTIQFDLPETAEVTVEVVDMLGRNVMSVPAQMMEAGANRTFQVNASNLASGTYLYRLVAKTASDTMIKTGRMTLIK